MNTPAGVLGAATLFWGWQAGLLPLAVALAAALEGVRWWPRRWDISVEDFTRVTDACAVLFTGLVAYAYLTRVMTLAIMAVISWLPACYAPVLLAQALSKRGRFSVSVLFWALRRRARRGESFGEIDLAWPFFIICVLSAAAANVRRPGFYGGMFLLSCWALWAVRPNPRERLAAPGVSGAGVPPPPPTGSGLAAAAMLAAAGLGGFVGQDRLHWLQGTLEKNAANILFGLVEVGADPLQTQTAIGRIGALKQSDAIVLRVASEGRPPELLRQAAYNIYRAGSWFTSDNTAGELPAGADGVTRRLEEDPAPADAPSGKKTALPSGDGGPMAGARQVTVSAFLKRGRGLLALPAGTSRVEGLAAGSVTRNRLGTVSVEEGAGLAVYRAVYAPGAGAVPSGAPERVDLIVPPREAGFMGRLSRELGLDRRDPRQSLSKVVRFFEQGFTYSVYQAGRKPGADPLEDFLFRTRSGHCEYYATATALLLRSAGIPARYATGYSVQEYSRLERSHIVRQRHAHAWALAFVDGAWRDVDTTPSTWAGVESSLAPWWGPARDLWSLAWYGFSRWRWAERSARDPGPWAWLILGAVAAAAWKVWTKARWRAGQAAAAGAARARPGLDSEFYLIEAALAGRGWGRRPWESWRAWARRLQAEHGFPLAEVSALAVLHERHRFDPAGLAPDERLALGAESRKLAARCRRLPPSG
ncbi:MAG: transglutaminase domain-containing protein [Elusimicrobia bacterium]|nr:transglutaminase domain-containing protein [Elusimicrobiota bacterium]